MKVKISILSGVIAFALTGASYAQTQIMRPTTIAPAQSNVAVQQSVESLQGEIVRLRNRIQSLQNENAALNNRIIQLTTKGGTLVRAYCSDDLKISKSTAGATEDCTFNGYTCQPVSGLCNRDCNTQDDCTPGYACDTQIHRCANTNPPKR